MEEQCLKNSEITCQTVHIVPVRPSMSVGRTKHVGVAAADVRTNDSSSGPTKGTKLPIANLMFDFDETEETFGDWNKLPFRDTEISF